MPMRETMLAVEGLGKVYSETASGKAGGLIEATFSLETGAFFTLLGPSGCGKTTTLRCIAGLETPDCGLIRVGNQAIFDHDTGIELPMNLRQFGMVFQSYAIWPHMSVFENVAFPLRVAKDRRFSEAEIVARVKETLDAVSLDGFGDRPATRLSGGQQQRVALARAIVRQPRLLLLDEPLSNLDAALREEMRKELRRLQQQIGITTIYVTHDQTEALELSDRIAVMREGRIVQMGKPREIYFRPGDAFVADFVGTTNWLHGTVAEANGRGRPKVQLSTGQTVLCAPREDVRSGQRVKVSVRPESLDLRDPRARPQDAMNRLTGTVAFAAFMGNMTRYQVAAADTLIQAYGNPETTHDIGAEVGLEFSFGSATIFPE